jgi:hypothetical protein
MASSRTFLVYFIFSAQSFSTNGSTNISSTAGKYNRDRRQICMEVKKCILSYCGNSERSVLEYEILLVILWLNADS